MKINTRKLIYLLIPAFLICSVNQAVAEDGKRKGGPRERPDFFALADTDENGGVTLEELVDSRMKVMERRMERAQSEGQNRRGGDPAQLRARLTERMTAAFEEADSDENGELSREEFDNMPMGRGGPGGRNKGGGKKNKANSKSQTDA